LVAINVRKMEEWIMENERPMQDGPFVLRGFFEPSAPLRKGLSAGLVIGY